MIEISEMQESVSLAFVDTYLRIRRLERVIIHTPGCIVRKKGYPYWQFRQNRKQIQKYIQKQQLSAVESLVEKMKKQLQRLRELRVWLRDLKRALRAIRIRWQEVLAAFEEAEARQEQAEACRLAAKKTAAAKRYGENYKHLTDKGDHVASKSEEIIANQLFAKGVKYEYERPFETGKQRLLPDFTIWRPDGTMLLWEHAGLMDQPEYARRFRDKLRIYEEAGFVQQKNLIVTQDENGTLSAEEVRRMLELYRIR